MTLDDCPTISLFASKLPYKMMEHICHVVKPQDFQGWADAARQYHQDNTTVQNLRNLDSNIPRKFGNKKTGFSAKQWAQILGVKLPTPDSNAMDTHADRTRFYFRNKGSKGCTGTTKEDPVKQCQDSHGPAMAYMSHGRANAESLLEFMDSRRRLTLEILNIFLGQLTSAESGGGCRI